VSRSRITSIGIDGHEAVYVSDLVNHRTEKFSRSGALLRRWQLPAFPYWWYADHFWAPFLVRMAVDRTGNVYVFDALMTLTKYSSTGRMLRRWHIRLRRSDVNARGYPVPSFPLAIALGPHGTIYLSVEARGPFNRGGESEYLFMQRRSVQGVLLDEWRNLTQAASGGGPLVATGVAVDDKGDVWVTDGGKHGIVKLSPHGLRLQGVGLQGCGAGRFEEPSAIALDSGNRIYVADRGNHSIQVFSAQGDSISYWGTCHS
jgi:tripartite motif-containing protein 71